jgi:hypothetical protein
LQNNLSPLDFQAILQVPMIIVGTENLPVHRGHWEFNNTLQCSWETGLPVVNYNMSRTSVSHALSLLQLISTPDIPKRRLVDMNGKPLLLTSHVAQLLPTERRLIDLSDSLGMVGYMSVYKLDIRDFTSSWPGDTLEWEIVAHESFDETPFAHALEGIGALRAQQDSVFYSFTDTAGVELQFSCWVYIASDIPGFPALRVRHTTPDRTQVDEEIHSIHSFNPWQVRGSWVEITFPLVSKMTGTQHEFSTLASKAVIDELVIKKK